MRILRLITLFLIATFSLQAVGYIGLGKPVYAYDANLGLPVYGNTKFKLQNFSYDAIPNFYYGCGNSLNSDLYEKAREGSFFVFKVGLVATKGVTSGASNAVNAVKKGKGRKGSNLYLTY